MKLLYFYLCLVILSSYEHVIPCHASRAILPPSFNLIKRLFRRRRRKVSFELVVELQDKIKILEKELHASREQVQQLKSLLNEHHHVRRLGVVNEVLQLKQYQHSESLLKEQIHALNTKIEDLSKSNGEIEATLIIEKSKVQELRQKLSNDMDIKLEMEQHHRSELAQLRKELDTKMQELVHAQSEDNEMKVVEEIQKLKNKLKTERKQFKKEKQELLDAVEAEKVKMRRLVKVLAEKEKREVAMNRASLDHND